MTTNYANKIFNSIVKYHRNCKKLDNTIADNAILIKKIKGGELTFDQQLKVISDATYVCESSTELINMLYDLTTDEKLLTLKKQLEEIKTSLSKII